MFTAKLITKVYYCIHLYISFICSYRGFCFLVNFLKRMRISTKRTYFKFLIKNLITNYCKKNQKAEPVNNQQIHSASLPKYFFNVTCFVLYFFVFLVEDKSFKLCLMIGFYLSVYFSYLFIRFILTYRLFFSLRSFYFSLFLLCSFYFFYFMRFFLQMVLFLLHYK